MAERVAEEKELSPEEGSAARAGRVAAAKPLPPQRGAYQTAIPLAVLRHSASSSASWAGVGPRPSGVITISGLIADSSALPARSSRRASRVSRDATSQCSPRGLRALRPIQKFRTG